MNHSQKILGKSVVLYLKKKNYITERQVYLHYNINGLRLKQLRCFKIEDTKNRSDKPYLKLSVAHQSMCSSF